MKMIFKLEFWPPQAYYIHRDTYTHSYTHTTQAQEDRQTDTETWRMPMRVI